MFQRDDSDGFAGCGLVRSTALVLLAWLVVAGPALAQGKTAEVEIRRGDGSVLRVFKVSLGEITR